jgi:hypothetical protein
MVKERLIVTNSAEHFYNFDPESDGKGYLVMIYDPALKFRLPDKF